MSFICWGILSLYLLYMSHGFLVTGKVLMPVVGKTKLSRDSFGDVKICFGRCDMLIAASFPLARSWRQLQCPLMDEWLRKTQCSPQTRIFFGLRKEVPTPATAQVDLGAFAWHEMSQSQKDKHGVILLLCGT